MGKLSETVPFRPVYYSQTDKRWADTGYSAPGESTTIGKAGCGPTSAAMIASEWGYETTPADAARWSLQHGYKAKNQGTYYSFFKAYFKELGMTCTQLNDSNLRSTSNANKDSYFNKLGEALKMGDMAILCLGKSKWTSSGHFVVCYRKLYNTYYLNDPNKGPDNEAYQLAGSNELMDAVKYIWVVEQPANYHPATGKPYTVDTTDGNVNVRLGPGTYFDVHTVLNNGYTIYVDETQGGWHRFEMAGTRAYVHNSQVIPASQYVAPADPWWQKAADDLRGKGIINGDSEGKYDGEETATKGVVAQMIYNLLQYLKED